MEKRTEFFVIAEETCPLCDGCGYVYNAMWASCLEELGDSLESPINPAMIQEWWLKQGFYKDEIPPEEDTCNTCNGTGRHREEIRLAEALHEEIKGYEL